MFGRPFMGGLERKGTIATVRRMKPGSGDRCAGPGLGPVHPGRDCTVPAGTSWDNLHAAVAAAHNYR